MGFANARVPLWCAFLAAITAIALICVSVASIGDVSWLPHSVNIHEVSAMARYTRLESWERDTALEYAPRLRDSTSRSQPPQVRYYEFNISSRATYIGGVRRDLLLINGQYPGPLIETVEGDTLIVNVTNRMANTDDDPQRVTSIHFHGQMMNGTNFYDGSVGLTQCGIPPGKTFTYKFVTARPGTFWYHSHWGLQQIEGLVGPMITHERKKPGNYTLKQETETLAGGAQTDQRQLSRGLQVSSKDTLMSDWGLDLEGSEHKDAEDDPEEAVVFLSDLYDRPAESLLLDYMEPWIGGVEEPVPSIALAQGKINTVIELSKGGKARVRIINACSYTAFNVELNGGRMTVIEADSTPTKPTTVGRLLLYPAQRYSILLDLDDQGSARLHTTPQRSLYGDLGLSKTLAQNSASLHASFITQNKTLQDLTSTYDVQLDENELVEPYIEPLEQSSSITEGPADSEHFVDISMTRLRSGEIAGVLNGQIQEWLPADSLLSMVLKDTAHTHEHSFTNNNEAMTRSDVLLELNATGTVDFVIRNYDDGPHPVHLHGHRVWIMSRGDLKSMEPTWVSTNPLRRDTVWLPKDEWVRVRLMNDNPGVWTLHCHIPWHSRVGMKGAILALPSKLIKKRPPSDWYELCQG